MAYMKRYLVCQVCGKDITKQKHKQKTCGDECFKIYRKKWRAEWFQLNKSRIIKQQKEYRHNRIKELRGLEL